MRTKPAIGKADLQWGIARGGVLDLEVRGGLLHFVVNGAFPFAGAHACLFLADHLSGLLAVALHDGSIRPLASPTTPRPGGIDGFVLHRCHLSGVQNGSTPQRIAHILLDRSGTRVDDLRMVQWNHPLWREPTHGAMVGDAFHYIATSN